MDYVNFIINIRQVDAYALNYEFISVKCMYNPFNPFQFFKT